MKKLILYSAALSTFFLFGSFVSGVQAATLGFNPTSINVSEGDTFDVDIIVNTNDAQITGVDALLQFDASVLEVTGISNGTFLEVGHKDYAVEGQAYVVGYVNSPGESVTGEGVLATVSFNAVGGGNTTISYICEVGETGESNILEFSLDAPDLIECGQNGEVVVVAEGTSTGDDSSGSTGSDGSSGSSGRSGSSGSSGSTGGGELPKSGVFEDLIVFIVAGGVLFAVGVGTRFLA